ncbi:unnamed protein product [Phytomonas sp. EM1]|nr:unnamed protein product [Phytomonas sp. EM1]|eukprot:CCW59836.1 unnamed protein product [Phytomonas sp. isolate EM1]
MNPMDGFQGMMATSCGEGVPLAPAVLTENPFGVVVPGRPVWLTFQALDATHWTVALGDAPKSFVVFLTQSVPLPAGCGIEVYLAREMDPNGGFVYVGALTAQNPSSLIQTPNTFLNVDQPVRIVLGLALGTEDSIQNLSQSVKPQLEEAQMTTKIIIAERILEDLCNFVLSYARSIKPGDLVSQYIATEEEHVLMPASFVTKWRDRVMTRLRKDASFWN